MQKQNDRTGQPHPAASLGRCKVCTKEIRQGEDHLRVYHGGELLCGLLRVLRHEIRGRPAGLSGCLVRERRTPRRGCSHRTESDTQQKGGPKQAYHPKNTDHAPPPNATVSLEAIPLQDEAARHNSHHTHCIPGKS